MWVVVDADESNPGIRRMLGVNESNPTLMDMIGGRTHAFGTLKDAASDELQAAVKSVMEKTDSSGISPLSRLERFERPVQGVLVLMEQYRERSSPIHSRVELL